MQNLLEEGVGFLCSILTNFLELWYYFKIKSHINKEQVCILPPPIKCSVMLDKLLYLFVLLCLSHENPITTMLWEIISTCNILKLLLANRKSTKILFENLCLFSPLRNVFFFYYFCLQIPSSFLLLVSPPRIPNRQTLVFLVLLLHVTFLYILILLYRVLGESLSLIFPFFSYSSTAPFLLFNQAIELFNSCV